MGKTFGQSSSDLQIICTFTPWMVLHLVNNNNDSFIYPLFKIITLANYYITIMRHVNKTSWKLQSNRMFFWWELCKLPPQHWYFDWQFESSKLQPVRASCNLCEQVAQFSWYLVAKCFKCYFNIVKTGLRVFRYMSHWAATKIYSILWNMLCYFFK